MSGRRKKKIQRLNRRQFVGRVSKAVMSAGILGPFIFDGCASKSAKTSQRIPQGQGDPDRNKVYDCVILGAGMAGMTTARTLKDLDPSLSVLVLEGSQRLGGRMFTNREMFGGPIEFGAEYIHRHRGSVPLWDEVDRYKLTAIPVPKRTKGLVYWVDEGQSSLMNMNQLTHHVGLCAKLDLLKVDLYKGHDVSGEMFLDRHHLKGLNRFMVQMALNGHLPASLDDLSVKGYASDKILTQLRELNDFSVKEGFDSIIHSMAEGVDVRLGSPIRVVRRRAGGVEILTENGDTFSAKSAVMTFSVNMLKSGFVKFEPELPDEKLEALDGLHMGDVAKTIIQFKQRFWPVDMSMLHWPGEGHMAGRTFFHDFYGRPYLAPILTSFLVGETASNMQKIEDQDLINRVCRDLDQVFPAAAPTINQVARDRDGRMIYFRKHWGQDPWARGGYSFIRYNPGSKIPIPKIRHVLKDHSSTEPLFWAGEATSVLTQPASVHGANSSGLEAAKAVFHFLRSGRQAA